MVEKMQQLVLGKFIKYKRELSGCSLNRFAIDAGIEPATLSRIENLKQDVKFMTLCKIAKNLEVSTSEFLAEFEKQIEI
ncbi:MAG: helix-turn-helix transcriptional regulator [Candidatus Gastranaerophilales bacterium]